jgi:phage terminase large subunit-like protein
VIEAFCEAVGRHRKLVEAVDQAGIVDATGKLHPALRTIEATAATVKNLAAVLGLVPTGKRPAQPKGGDDPWSSVLDRARALKPKPLFPILTEPTTASDLIPSCQDCTGRGAAAWAILSMLRLTEGEHAGKRIGDNAPPWQEKLTKLLFGHTDADGNRLINEAFLAIAKKSGKTAYCSAVAITWLLLEQEAREQVVMLAASKDQARIAFESAAAMIRADDSLAQRFEILDFRSLIRYKRTSSRCTAIASELAAVVGANVSFAIVDELHLLGATSKGAKLVGQIRSGSIARKEPLLVSISTAPIDRSEGIFESTLSRARRIISGEEIDPHFFGWICEPPKGVDPESPEHWHWANPSLGYTITLDRIRAQYESAQSDPVALATFRSQNLNIQPDTTAGAGRWLSLAQWDAAADPTLTLDKMVANAVDCWAGIDIGGLDDLSALLIMGQTTSGEFQCWSHQWISQQGFEKRVSVNEYEKWIDAGELTKFEDGGADLDEILDIVKMVHASGKLRLCGADQYGAPEVETLFTAAGIEVRNVPSGWKLTPLIAWIERRLADKALKHDGSPVLRWNIGNAIVNRVGAQNLKGDRCWRAKNRRMHGFIACRCRRDRDWESTATIL